MRWLESVKAGVSLTGLAPNMVVTMAVVMPIGPDAVQVYYDIPDGTPRNALLTEADSARVRLAVAERPWTFDGDPDRFKLVVDARRFELAHLLDPMNAIHTPNVRPLPHQITAVYEHLLPRQPLRFVLDDDPGAGKTIMAGLYIRELVLRADAQQRSCSRQSPSCSAAPWLSRSAFSLSCAASHSPRPGPPTPAPASSASRCWP